MTKYSVTRSVRLTQDEYDRININAKEAGMSVSSYVRNRATNSKIPRPLQDKENFAQLRSHFGLLKNNVSNNELLRPILNDIQNLIILMTKKMS